VTYYPQSPIFVLAATVFEVHMTLSHGKIKYEVWCLL